DIFEGENVPDSAEWICPLLETLDPDNLVPSDEPDKTAFCWPQASNELQAIAALTIKDYIVTEGEIGSIIFDRKHTQELLWSPLFFSWQYLHEYLGIIDEVILEEGKQ